MDWLKKILLFLTLAVSVISADFPSHKMVLKTILQARKECKQYLRSPESSVAECEARCIELVLRSWIDSSGLQSIPFKQHFQPDSSDTEYRNRTQQCLDEATAGISGDYSCCQSSAALQCYRSQYGNVVRTPKLVPAPNLLISGAIRDCTRILEIDDLELKYGASVNFTLSDKTRKLLRCVLIRLGLYNDETGPDLDRIYVQCGDDQVDELSFKQNARDCVDRLRAECTDKSTLATRIATQCFPDECSPLSIVKNGLDSSLAGDNSSPEANATTTSTAPVFVAPVLKGSLLGGLLKPVIALLGGSDADRKKGVPRVEVERKSVGAGGIPPGGNSRGGISTGSAPPGGNSPVVNIYINIPDPTGSPYAIPSNNDSRTLSSGGNSAGANNGASTGNTADPLVSILNNLPVIGGVLGDVGGGLLDPGFSGANSAGANNNGASSSGNTADTLVSTFNNLPVVGGVLGGGGGALGGLLSGGSVGGALGGLLSGGSVGGVGGLLGGGGGGDGGLLG